ncbi:MAG: methyltransferase type 12, partial [Streptosporangiaceae bacterium]
HLPERARRALWAERYPGLPGPFPAVYSPEASDRGIQAYAHLRGLTIAHRETGTTWPGRHDRAGRGDRRLRTGRLACRLIRRLTRGRATDAYDEVSYVIRRPEDRFARVL